MTERIFIVHEPAHVYALETLLHSGESVSVLALDAEVEQMLLERHIPYISGKGFRDPQQVEMSVFAEEYARGLISAAWNFLSYRDISLGKLFVFPLQEYLNWALYYIELFKRFADDTKYTEWVVYEPVSGPPIAGGPLAAHMYNVVLRSAKLVAESRGIVLRTIPLPREAVNGRTRRLRFVFVRLLLSVAVASLNTVVTMLRRPRTVRLLVTDLWKNMAAWTSVLPESEILLLDRSELARIPFKAIWRHRIRFIHLSQFLTREDTRRAAAHGQQCKNEWQTLRAQINPVFFRGTDLRPLLLDAFDTLIISASPAVRAQIDGAYGLIVKTRPMGVVVRASVSGQTHFGVLAMVSKKLGVPAIEQQHGLEYLGAGSLSRNHAAEYLALYGPKIRAEFESIGYEPARLIYTGSARFDGYRPLATEDKNAVLCIAPDLYLGLVLDTYSCVDYFEAFFAALPEGREAVVKLRNGQRESFFISTIERLRGTRTCRIEKDRPLSTLFAGARTVVSCYSTAVLESMLSGLPVVMMPISPMEVAVTRFHFDEYAASGAVRIAWSTAELRTHLAGLESGEAYKLQRQAALDFLSKNFLFDGKASERFAALVRSLTRAVFDIDADHGRVAEDVV